MDEETIAVVLAAGKGTRMESELPKVLVPAGGRPMLHWVLDALRDADVDRVVVVVGYEADRVRQSLADRQDVSFALQEQQLGTGHAVMQCEDQLRDHVGPVLVVTGDSPLTRPESLRRLLEMYRQERPACVLGTLLKEDPTGLGRIVRDADGTFRGIVEEKDATPLQRSIREVNMSTYVFHTPDLLEVLPRLGRDNQQGELYITDCPGLLGSLGRDVRALPVLQPCEALSVNSMSDLQAVEDQMRRLGMI